MKTITKEELKKRLENDDIILIDVLSEEEYKDSHIKGAVNIPLKMIGTKAEEKYDKDDEIVVYCSDADCNASPTAAKKLEDLGFKNVYDFEGGKKEWREAGYPME
ncbi:MAG: rhodanese-like domain-containing protein [Bacteroidota bacterium]